ncbi:hypothetical protein J7E90_32405 [Streptomyces sp. ISL-111]|uniref:hypothetical protein n=1 Tax=Streptomyces sp. ISL-111 TaxID=2819175 RepID=UPI001BECF0DA|nr:hypothetical protein [Streptomyces sp. ISL-111]MBT2381862.1 hypothetical protein [Streptomyces sp. ISL-111]
MSALASSVGRFYAEAVRRRPGYLLAGVLSRGSAASRAYAQSLDVADLFDLFAAEHTATSSVPAVAALIAEANLSTGPVVDIDAGAGAGRPSDCKTSRPSPA